MSSDETHNNIVRAANDRTTNMTEMQRCLEKASARGYTNQFRATQSGLKCVETDQVYQPDQVLVTNFFRFEGISDPDDMSILYEIETHDGCKGTLIDAYGVYSDPKVGRFMLDVEEIHKKRPHVPGYLDRENQHATGKRHS